VEVSLQVSVDGSYTPPVFKLLVSSLPPHTTIFDPVQTAVG